MLTKYKYLSTVLFLMLTNAAWSQLDIRLTAAYGKMYLKPRTGLIINSDPADYVTAGLQADYYIYKNFGIGLGVDYYLLESKFDIILTDYDHRYEGVDNWEVDPVPREYEFTVKSNAPDIIEQNTMSFLDFPISAIHNFPLINNIKLATRLGVKVGLPLTGNYVLQESDLFTRLYFEEWDLELFNIPAHGLYDSRTDWYPEGELNLNMVFSVFTELGLDFPVSLLKVRVSGYFSYGLNDIIDEKQSSLIYWREDYNNILSLAESVRTMQLGVKIGIGLMSKREKLNNYKTKGRTRPKRRTKCAWEF